MTSGLYVHLPFCSALCPYCDFAVIVGKRDEKKYCAALLEEAKSKTWDEPFDTAFIGGGTPTYVEPKLLAETLEQLFGLFHFGPSPEISIEANPESVESASLQLLHSVGVNRVSVGGQSFDDGVLRALGRTHSSADVVASVSAARAAGFDDVSIDLIYGYEPLDTWMSSLRAAIALGVDHISCYALTIEERTAFGKAVATGRMPAPDDDALADKFLAAVDLLGEAGFEHYEVSNWAKPGKRCAHNMTYWTQGDYLGLGLGAHSHRAGHRWWNTRALPQYLMAPDDAVEGEERLDERARAEEWLSLRLRLCGGFDVAAARDRLGSFPDTSSLEEAGLVVRSGDLVRLTDKGMLVENELTANLLNGTIASRA